MSRPNGRGAVYRVLHSAGFSTTEIAAKFGVSQQAVSQHVGGGRVGHLKRNDRKRRRQGRGEYHCRLCGAAGHNRATCQARRAEEA